MVNDSGRRYQLEGVGVGLNCHDIPYAIGDLVPVKEAYCWSAASGYDKHPDFDSETGAGSVWYKATDLGKCEGPYLSPITMPAWASRLTARITDVRVQRAQDLSEADAMAMGGLSEQYDTNEEIPVGYCHGQDLSHRKGEAWFETPVDSFQDLWNTTHGPDAWERNDWIYVLNFQCIKKNISEVDYD